MYCLGGDPLPGQKLKARHSAYPKGVGAEAPAWVAFDRQVSCDYITYRRKCSKYEINQLDYREFNCD